MKDIVTFVLVSAGIAAFTWNSFRHGHRHSFHRFFAFESILVSVLLVRRQWFIDPFSPAQIISWILLAGSLAMALHAIYLYMTTAIPQGYFENARAIVVRGVYKHIRHPMYASLCLLAWGVCCKDVSLQTLLLGMMSSLFLYATAKVEESENIQRFGPSYEEYMKTTTMFIPRIF